MTIKTPEFISNPLADPDRLKLTLSNNTKTSPIVSERNDSRGDHNPKFSNSFGLVAKKSCPGKTEFCEKFCYAVETERRTNVWIAMNRNYNILKDLDEEGIYHLLREMIQDYNAAVVKKKIAPEDDVFRIHWDGDFFSVAYARAWARIIRENPQTLYWVYTRSFKEPVNVIPELYGIDNLALYLSVDEENIDDALKIRDEFPKIGMAFCAKDQYQSEKLAEYAGKRKALTTPCPENIGKIALALNGHGACIECKLCLKKRPNILFEASEVYDTEAQQELFSWAHTVPVEVRRNPVGEGIVMTDDLEQNIEPIPLLAHRQLSLHEQEPEQLLLT